MTATADPPRRVALVTGAARGIGAAVVARLVARDCLVYALDLCAGDEPAHHAYPLATQADLHAVADRHGEQVVPVVVDARDREAMAAVAARVEAEQGALHIVVAAAGVIAGGAAAWETDNDVLEALWQANAVTVWNTAAATIPLLLRRTAEERPSFVALGSVAGERGLYRLAAYCMAKHAVVGLVRALAQDLSGQPVTVACVNPGSTDTHMLAATANLYGLDDIDALVREQAVGRAFDPDEIASVVEFACTAGPVVHGAVLEADGGFR